MTFSSALPRPRQLGFLASGWTQGARVGHLSSRRQCRRQLQFFACPLAALLFNAHTFHQFTLPQALQTSTQHQHEHTELTTTIVTTSYPPIHTKINAKQPPAALNCPP